MDGAGDSRPSQIRTHKMVSGGVVIEEHGCICPWDDDPGGTHEPTSGSSHHITLLFSHRW